MSVIQIRGTSGSGKTTVMRDIMDAWCYRWTPVYRQGRRKPLYYLDSEQSVVVLGHYEDTACGGCDTIGSARVVTELVEYVLDLHKPAHVLCEGLLLSEDVKWAKYLNAGLTVVKPIFLTTPLEQCLRQIEGRRKAAGNAKPLNPANTINRVRVIERARLKLTEAGVYCRRASVPQAVKLVLSWLNN